MADSEEEDIERQVEQQLQEQKDSLLAIDQALAADPNNLELLAVHEELVSAIVAAEEGLLSLRHARSGKKNDPQDQVFEPYEDTEVESFEATIGGMETVDEESYSVGSKCRFQHTDGHWYGGQIIQLDGSGSAKLSFLRPTSESMLICKFFLQERCRFGASCRFSHGIDVPLSSLRTYVPTSLESSLVGSSMWAVSQNKAKGDVWREAELESWDEKLQQGRVVFRDDASSENLGIEAIALSPYADASDEEESDSSSEQSDSTDAEDDEPQGLGFVESTALQSGIQTETAIFAKWENHTRGIASKMMAKMGYSEGMGLGLSGQGMVDPIAVKVLPPKQSLDHALQSSVDKGEKEIKAKKRSRGGKRKRDKKLAEAARAAKAEEESRPDVFSLINTQLAVHGESLNQVSAKKQKGKEEKKEDRRALIAYEDEMKELRRRVEKLEEMVNRNRKEKVVYEAALRKLGETRKALAEAEAAHASTNSAVVGKEKEKRWLKF
ncbi:hypothetical protein Drorol1_Dr00016984 [Drosera rotundifolia]